MRLAAWPLLLALSAALVLPAAAQDVREAGVTAAANPAVEGTPPAATARLLQVGVKVFERERVVAQPDGQAQLLFRDGSTFTVGPNSDMVIDDFVFDPNAGTGKIAMSLGKGVFRFVGGKLSKDGAVSMTTPSAVLGVRGGIALIEVGATGMTTATLVYGNELSVRSLTGETVRMTRPGFSVTVPDARSPPGAPLRVGADQMARGIAPLQGQQGRAGGLAEPPPPQAVAAALKAPVQMGPTAGPAPTAGAAAAPAPRQPSPFASAVPQVQGPGAGAAPGRGPGVQPPPPRPPPVAQNPGGGAGGRRPPPPPPPPPPPGPPPP